MTNAYYATDYNPFPFEKFAEIIGGHNWVIARRTSRIVAQYGENVICLSPKKFATAERLARLALTESFD